MERFVTEEVTSASLLAAVTSTSDQLSWQRFLAIYEPMLHRWLRLRGFSEHLVSEVISEVFVKLVTHMPVFVYDKRKSFRGWLRTVVERTATDIECRAYRKYETLVDFQRIDISIAAPQRFQDSNGELDEFVEKLNERFQLAAAIVRHVKKRVSRKTWQAFYMTEVEGQSCEVVAETLRMKSGTVYVYRFRVKNLLRTEAQKREC